MIPPFNPPAPRELSLVSAIAKIDEALRDFEYASDATERDAVLYANRARTSLLYAQRRAQATLARWHEYEASLSKIFNPPAIEEGHAG